jgi:hypothetical protein
MGGYDIGAFELCLNQVNEPCIIYAGLQEKEPLTIQAALTGGGTTIPAPGTYDSPLNSVVPITAVPDPNYCFMSWTGPVTILTNVSTTVVIDQAQNVTANFAPPVDSDQVVTSTVDTSLLRPPNHNVVDVGLTAASHCGAPATFQVRVFGDEDDATPTDSNTVFSPDAAHIAVGTLRLRAERKGSGDGRVYLIVVCGTDAAGNTGFACSTVVVPHDASKSSKASVNSQAAAAQAYCEANNGAPPAGFFPIGDGPVVGPKQ